MHFEYLRQQRVKTSTFTSIKKTKICFSQYVQIENVVELFLFSQKVVVKDRSEIIAVTWKVCVYVKLLDIWKKVEKGQNC